MPQSQGIFPISSRLNPTSQIDTYFLKFIIKMSSQLVYGFQQSPSYKIICYYFNSGMLTYFYNELLK